VERRAARRFDLGGRGVDRARQLGMRFGRFRHDRDVRAVARRPQRNREPDAATGTCDQERLPA